MMMRPLATSPIADAAMEDCDNDSFITLIMNDTAEAAAAAAAAAAATTAAAMKRTSSTQATQQPPTPPESPSRRPSFGRMRRRHSNSPTKASSSSSSSTFLSAAVSATAKSLLWSGGGGGGSGSFNRKPALDIQSAAVQRSFFPEPPLCCSPQRNNSLSSSKLSPSLPIAAPDTQTLSSPMTTRELRLKGLRDRLSEQELILRGQVRNLQRSQSNNQVEKGINQDVLNVRSIATTSATTPTTPTRLAPRSSTSSNSSHRVAASNVAATHSIGTNALTSPAAEDVARLAPTQTRSRTAVGPTSSQPQSTTRTNTCTLPVSLSPPYMSPTRSSSSSSSSNINAAKVRQRAALSASTTSKHTVQRSQTTKTHSRDIKLPYQQRSPDSTTQLLSVYNPAKDESFAKEKSPSRSKSVTNPKSRRSQATQTDEPQPNNDVTSSWAIERALWLHEKVELLRALETSNATLVHTQQQLVELRACVQQSNARIWQAMQSLGLDPSSHRAEHVGNDNDDQAHEHGLFSALSTTPRLEWLDSGAENNACVYSPSSVATSEDDYDISPDAFLPHQPLYIPSEQQTPTKELDVPVCMSDDNKPDRLAGQERQLLQAAHVKVLQLEIEKSRLIEVMAQAYVHMPVVVPNEVNTNNPAPLAQPLSPDQPVQGVRWKGPEPEPKPLLVGCSIELIPINSVSTLATCDGMPTQNARQQKSATAISGTEQSGKDRQVMQVRKVDVEEDSERASPNSTVDLNHVSHGLTSDRDVCAQPQQRNEAEQLEITRQQLETARATISVLRDEMELRHVHATELWERRVGGLELQLAQANYELYQVKQETNGYALQVKGQVLDFLDTLHFGGRGE